MTSGRTLDPHPGHNPIESTFATVRLRTAKTRGCVARASILAMVFKLTKRAEQRWRKLKSAARLAQVIDGVRFKTDYKRRLRESPPEIFHTQHLQKLSDSLGLVESKDPNANRVSTIRSPS